MNNNDKNERQKKLFSLIYIFFIINLLIYFYKYENNVFFINNDNNLFNIIKNLNKHYNQYNFERILNIIRLKNFVNRYHHFINQFFINV